MSLIANKVFTDKGDKAYDFWNWCATIENTELKNEMCEVLNRTTNNFYRIFADLDYVVKRVVETLDFKYKIYKFFEKENSFEESKEELKKDLEEYWDDLNELLGPLPSINYEKFNEVVGNVELLKSLNYMNDLYGLSVEE